MGAVNKDMTARQTMPIVHGFVQMWTRYESGLHREIAVADKAETAHKPARKKYSFINYGLFYRVSSCLNSKRQLTMGELSKSLGVPLSTATRIMDWLVNDGLATRLHDPEDRRVVRVALTNTGLSMYRTINDFAGKRASEILSCLTQKEHETLSKLIHKIINALEKAT
jgi:DNA-binding MarR family transcriptional regulator